ncbi:ATP-binding protein [Flavobacteriaceae bacterium]|jgi:two-component system phosphate regulon sensor histidine kinase PhoR|nr:ATP-binding protein [Flavobacteriaceae bacterium]MDB3914116.1 ATP-binding protein [Flavobacteriaceae bacterium]MDB4497422.1 ATP-binding protein [Flavobacteriaceae bacterium]MDC0652186.1 ATP-binding protein [Flavobacteriaceae bacterium]MDC3319703.1 ATP-binding protein [Flavobacteriaceae bacterium]
MKLKKTYSFSLLSSVYLTISLVLIGALIYFLFPEDNKLLRLIIFFPTVFIVVFLIIQYRTEQFIYNRIKKIYDEVSILNDDEFIRASTTTDIDSLSNSVKNYVQGKRIEIKNLTERDSFRKDFLGNVSHELKTPLFTVQGYILTLIEGGVNDKLIRDKYLERANKGVDRLVAIVKDLDMIAKLETEGLKMNYEVFNIIDLIQNVFDLFEMKAKKRNISLQFDKLYDYPIFVKADKERIEQVLINLIVNSIKYGKTNGVTTVGLESYTEDQFILKVIDNGEGIKQEHIPRLFERFYRVDQSRSREQGGSGLGLSIVKHIVEAHNETMLINSVFKEGSEFSFTLKKAK